MGHEAIFDTGDSKGLEQVDSLLALNFKLTERVHQCRLCCRSSVRVECGAGGVAVFELIEGVLPTPQCILFVALEFSFSSVEDDRLDMHMMQAARVYVGVSIPGFRSRRRSSISDNHHRMSFAVKPGW